MTERHWELGAKLVEAVARPPQDCWIHTCERKHQRHHGRYRERREMGGERVHGVCI